MRLKADLALNAKAGNDKSSLTRSLQEKDQMIGELRNRISELNIEVAHLSSQQNQDGADKDQQISQLTYSLSTVTVACIDSNCRSRRNRGPQRLDFSVSSKKPRLTWPEVNSFSKTFERPRETRSIRRSCRQLSESRYHGCREKTSRRTR